MWNTRKAQNQAAKAAPDVLRKIQASPRPTMVPSPYSMTRRMPNLSTRSACHP